MRSGRPSRAALIAALLVLLAPLVAVAQDVILQNDSFTPGDAAAFQALFDTGEIAAARLVPAGPFPVQVKGVQFLFGGAAGADTITLHIWDDGAETVDVGAPLFTQDFPLVASDSALQQIDLRAASIMVSGPFRVGIEFHHAGTPSIARDTDGGATAGRNFVFSLGTWYDAGDFSIPGDWIIRAAVDEPPIFTDGFESGDLLAWSSAQTDGGDLSVGDGAALDGTGSGLRALVDDTAPLFVTDATPDGLSRYRARFYFDPNGFDPGEAQDHLRTRIFIAFDETPLRRLAAVVLRRREGGYALMARARLDDNAQADTGFVTISDGPHAVEIDWKQSSGPNANDGWIHLWIDGVPAGSRTGLDNNASTLDFVRMGALSVKTGASGALYWDEFVSRNQSYIGP